jgi:hypothetical protein
MIALIVNESYSSGIAGVEAQDGELRLWFLGLEYSAGVT